MQFETMTINTKLQLETSFPELTISDNILVLKKKGRHL